MKQLISMETAPRDGTSILAIFQQGDVVEPKLISWVALKGHSGSWHVPEQGADTGYPDYVFLGWMWVPQSIDDVRLP